MTALIVPQRFCGPPTSGNGGWTSGALAGLVEHDSPDDHSAAWPAVEVTLFAPPPLDTELAVRVDGEATTAHADATRIASASVVHVPLTPVEPAGYDDALAGQAAYPGHRYSPFPSCFTCGRDREEGDGLRIFPGPMPSDPERFAATWTPHPSTAEDWHAYGDAHRLASVAVTWAALDCPGGWAGGLETRPMVLGRMTARVDALPQVGRRHVVVGEHRGTVGRKTRTASTLYDEDGRLLGTCEQTWIAVDPTAFAGQPIA